MRVCLLAIIASLSALRGADATTTMVGESVAWPVVDRDDLRFTRIPTDAGLSQRRVTQVVQDDRGFMWFATQYGLERYDGYSFKPFVHDPRDPNSISGVYVSTLFKDRSGRLWIGGPWGVDRLDPATEQFTRFVIGGDGLPAEAGRVVAIYQDRDDMLWLATGTGLYRLNGATGKVVRFKHEPRDGKSLSSNDVKAIGEDRHGNFWVGTAEGLDALDRVTGKVAFHIPVPEPLHLGFYEDRAGTFWIYQSSGSGLASYDWTSHRLIRYTFAQETPGPAITGIRAMLEDSAGNLWLASFGSGVLRFDRQNRKFVRYRNRPADPQSLPDDIVLALFQDREGEIWTGFNSGGFSHFNPRPEDFVQLRSDPNDPHGLDTNFIDSLFEDDRRCLWIGTADAVFRLDRATGRFLRFRTDSLGAKATIEGLAESRDGGIWLGTHGHGLVRLDQATARFSVFRHRSSDPESLGNDIVHCIFFAHDGRMWIGTDDGLDRFDPRSGRFAIYKVDWNNRWSQSYDSIAEDDHGMLWLGSIYSGVHRFDPAKRAFTVYHSNPSHPESLGDEAVGSVLASSSGVIWAGTQNGLYRFDAPAGQFVPCMNGMAALGRAVTCILQDEQGKLWMSTNLGLAEFDPATGQFKRYTVADGLPGNDLSASGAGCKGANGEMYFGGIDGGVAFNPAQISDDNGASPLALTDFRLPYAPSNQRTRALVRRALSSADQIDLASDENSFYLEFAALNFRSPGTNRYRFMLEGLDAHWNEVDSSHRTATYTTLPARIYTFRAQGATARGPWSEPGIVRRIHVLEPWWRTPWFLGAATAVGLSTAIMAMRFRLKRSERRERDLRTLARAARVTTVGELTASIAHEVHQPLAAVVTNGQACLRWLGASSPDLDEVRLSVEQMVQDGMRGSEVVSRIRALVRKDSPARGPIDLTVAIRDAVAISPMPADGPSARLEMAGNLPLALADRIQIQQVILNLLQNAIDATKAGTTGREQVRIRASQQKPGFLLVEIEDEGTGISAAALQRLFDPFFTTKSNGLGIGLSISRSIIESHGGRLWAESNAHGGATFRFTLPAVPGKAA